MTDSHQGDELAQATNQNPGQSGDAPQKAAPEVDPTELGKALVDNQPGSPEVDESFKALKDSLGFSYETPEELAKGLAQNKILAARIGELEKEKEARKLSAQAEDTMPAPQTATATVATEPKTDPKVFYVLMAERIPAVQRLKAVDPASGEEMERQIAELAMKEGISAENVSSILTHPLYGSFISDAIEKRVAVASLTQTETGHATVSHIPNQNPPEEQTAPPTESKDPKMDDRIAKLAAKF